MQTAGKRFSGRRPAPKAAGASERPRGRLSDSEEKWYSIGGRLDTQKDPRFLEGLSKCRGEVLLSRGVDREARWRAEGSTAEIGMGKAVPSYAPLNSAISNGENRRGSRFCYWK